MGKQCEGCTGQAQDSVDLCPRCADTQEAFEQLVKEDPMSMREPVKEEE